MHSYCSLTPRVALTHSIRTFQAWELISTTLRKSGSGVKMVSAAEAATAQKRGVPVIDIRPAGEHASGRIPDSVNVEFFRLINGWDPMKVARRATYAFFGILNGTEFNAGFFEEFEAAVPDKRKGAVIYCNIGGTLEPTGPSKFGQQSRSLTAAYELTRAGYKSVQVIKGGYAGWKKAEREIEYDE